MGRRLAVVTAIDRANRVVRAADPGGGEFEAAYHPNRMPWPLAQAWFDDSAAPAWRCLGPIGDRRLVFHDDFTRVSTTPYFGDTRWTYDTSDAGGTATASTSTDVQGAINLHRNAGVAGNEFHKTVDAIAIPAQGAADWMVWRVKTLSLPSAWGADVTSTDFGLYRSSDADFTGFSLGTVQTQFQVHSYGSSDVVTGVEVTTGFHVCELVRTHYSDQSEDSVAAWVDGDGPYVIPGGASFEATPFVAFGLIGTSDGGAATPARDFVVDYVHYEHVNPIDLRSDYAVN